MPEIAASDINATPRRQRVASAPVEPVTVSVADATRITGLPKTTLFALLKTGDLESVRIGRRRLIVYRSIVRMVENAPA